MPAQSIAFIAYICLALFVGVWGQRKGYSFGVGFIISLLLTFVVGAVTVVVLRDKATGRRGILTWGI